MNVVELGQHLAEVAQQMKALDARLGRIEGVIFRTSAPKRKEPPQSVKKEHTHVCHFYGGKCPMCFRNHVTLADGSKSSFAEFDHFFTNAVADADHTWLICKSCHSNITQKVISRELAAKAFWNYQRLRKTVPGVQDDLVFEPPSAA